MVYRLGNRHDEKTMKENMVIGLAASAVFPDSSDRLRKIFLTIVAPELNVKNIGPAFDQ